MLDNLLYCLNATMPIFSLMILGYLLRRLNIMSERFTKELNSFTFKVSLPVLVFGELYGENFEDTWDTGFVLFCFGITAVCILLLLLITRLFHVSDRAEFIQASFRSSAALLGVGIVVNLYGDAGFVPLMIVGAVPLYNITAVVLLSILRPGTEPSGTAGQQPAAQGTRTSETAAQKSVGLSGDVLKRTLKGIVTNPIILGIVFGFLWSVIKLPRPVIFTKAVTYVGNTATPLGLMALGGSLQFKSLGKRSGSIIVGTVFKLVAFCAMFLPLAIWLGYRNDKLLAILIMLGSPTTVSSFVMAKSMGHDGQTSAGVVMLSTLFSAFTLTGWLFVLKTWGLI